MLTRPLFLLMSACLLCIAVLFGLPSSSRASVAAGAAPAEARQEELTRFNNLGIAYLAQFKPAEAEKQFRLATALDDRYLPGLANAGIAALAQVHYEDAIAAFNRALTLDPNCIHARFNLSLILKLQGKAAEALVEAQRTLALDPRDPDIRYHVGSLHLAQRDFPRAISEFETVLKLDPNFVSAYYSLGRCWIASGDTDKGRRYMEEHRKLQQGTAATAAVGLRYGEQGRYSYALEDAGGSGPAQPLAKGEVTFHEFSVESGITFRHGGTGGLDALRRASNPAGTAPSFTEATLGALLGSGAALADVNGDGREDLLFLNAAPVGPARSSLWLNQGGLRFAESTTGPSITGLAMGAAFGDLDGDADPDLAVSSLGRVQVFVNDGAGSFRDASAEARLSASALTGLPGGVSLSDVDHDGDLDIFVGGLLAPAPSTPSATAKLTFPSTWPGTRSLLLINATGPSTETGPAPLKLVESSAKAHVIPAARRVTGAIFFDFDNDRDVDFAVASPGDGSTLYSNQRDGTFSDLGPASGLPPAAAIMGLTAGDYDNDGWIDLAATLWDGGLPRLLRNMRGSEPHGATANGSGAFAADATALAEISRQIAVPQFGAHFLDFDNDGHLDLITVNGSDVGPALFVFRNEGQGQFSDAGEITGASSVPARSGRALLSGDLDSDGDLDLVISNAGGLPTLLRNDGGNKRQWIRVAPAGLHSNRPGIGTKVEIKSGRLWQKIELAAGGGYLSQSSLIPHFGLGSRVRVDTLRLLWPSGVLQDEIQVKAGAVAVVQELDRKGSSCPILYAWNGSTIAFVSDFLGGSAIGYRTSPSTFNYPDTEEYVRIRADQLVARDGGMELRMVNQLEETIYFDRARLIAVDHREGVEIHPDERLVPGRPFPPFRLYAVTSSRPIASARDDPGRDVAGALAEIDRIYSGPPEESVSPHPGPRRTYKGYARDHVLTIDLGERAPGDAALLLMHGWIDYADSTSNVAAAQAGLSLVPPWIEALDVDNQWIRIAPGIGFPAGLPKTMTVDLTGLLPNGSRLVRIGTSMRIYWDQIRLATRLGEPPSLAAVEASVAQLRYRGFPALASPDGRMPDLYDYQRDQAEVHWMSHAGSYTRFGDVRELLLQPDDRYVVTRPGDEIALTFPAKEFPPIAEGFTRTFLLQTSGFGKDMDINSARPDTVWPLPFHAMQAYPPSAGEGYPYDRPEIQKYLETYNTRIVASPIPPLRIPASRF